MKVNQTQKQLNPNQTNPTINQINAKIQSQIKTNPLNQSQVQNPNPSQINDIQK